MLWNKILLGNFKIIIKEKKLYNYIQGVYNARNVKIVNCLRERAVSRNE